MRPSSGLRPPSPRRAGRRATSLIVLILLLATAALAQQVTLTWSEDFESYGNAARPAAWTDDGQYRLWPDPLAASNMTFGAQSPKTKGNRDADLNAQRPEGGTESVLANRWFTTAPAFEYRGRFYRANDASLVGISFFSKHPESAPHYQIALWRGAMRLFGPELVADSTYVPQSGAWQRFLIRAEQDGGAVRIRARFWKDDQPEPSTWLFDVTDRSASRLSAGRIGVWLSGGTGYFDDLSVTSQAVDNADHEPPAIKFSESGSTLDPTKTNSFNRDARVDVTAADGSGVATLSATLDGAAYTSGTPITSEGTHTVAATATDRAGNSASAQVAILIDKTAPVVTVRNAGTILSSGSLFAVAVKPEITVADLTTTTVTATLNGQSFTSGTTIDAEGTYTLAVSATDALAWTTTLSPIVFTIDRTPPGVAILESGHALQNGGRAVLNRDGKVDVQVTDPSATATITVDGQPYVANTPITIEAAHVVHARVRDAAGNTSDAEVTIVVDKTAPVIDVTPIPSLTNQIVRPVITVHDLTTTTLTAMLDDAPFVSGTAIESERTHTLAISATDEAGWTTALAPIVVRVDRTAPKIAFVAPAEDGVLTIPRAVVIGEADDAVRIVVNDVVAAIDAASHSFTTTPIELSEGANTLTAVATDAAGNEVTITRSVRVDTRAPQLTVASPLANACLDATQVEVRGTVSDASGAKVVVNGVEAAITGNQWTATIPTPNETRIAFTIEAVDASGHTSSATVPVTIDRTPPVLELTESGAPLNDLATNRTLAIYGRAVDNDPGASVTMTLDGLPYVSGTPIPAEKSYVLTAVAKDCAGHASDTRTIHFTIDRTAPLLSAIAPANGATIGTKPAITGHLSEDATVRIEGTGESATINGLDFALSATLTEGVNQLALVARDRAGNETRLPLAFTVKTIAPAIEITESGSPIASDALFSRIVTPVIRTSDPQATISATLDGQMFTPGSAISSDGRHTLSATVTDAVNHTASASAAFTVDRTAPHVTIASPAPNATFTATSVEVRGNVDASDVVRVLVNGVNATLSGTTFAATVPLDFGPSPIVVTAIDRAGNAGTASIEVTRGDDRIAILLMSPADGMLTNRPTTVVAGQVLTPSAPRSVKVNGIELPIDAAGLFRKTDFALIEGDNAITAATANGSVTVHVVADFTAPSLKVLADGIELADGARFTTAPAITLESDSGATFTIDGATVTNTTALASGGHALIAIARDAAGNETRIDRTFVIGQLSASLGCSITGLDPIDNTSVFGEHLRVAGRVNAEAILINGAQAAVSDGTFCAGVTLVPGRNEVLLQCARADGTPSGETGTTLVLNRWLDPDITITSPAAGSVITTNKITVSGTVGAGVVSGDVNGLPFTPVNGAFIVNDVAVAPGLNVIAARARTSSERMSVATTRVIARTGVPQLAITSPLAGTSTGGASVDVSGTYANVDPATIAIAGSSVTTQPLSDTTGRFTATVAIASTTTITAVGRSYAGVSVGSSVDVTHVAAAPSIAIVAPFDNASIASNTESVHVTGTFSAGDGAQVSVNGIAATISGGSFSADVDVASGVTPIVARVTAAEGVSATDAIRVIRFAGPLAVKETFPAANASDVDRGIAIVMLFDNALDATTVINAVRVADSANTAIPGDLFVDRDAVTFAPGAPLRAGEHYSVTIATSLHDLAGGALASAHAFGFTVAASAPSTPPTIDQSEASGCLTSQTISGHTSEPGARVRLDVDGVTTTTTASASNAFTFNFTFSGQSGNHAVRVREIGADGTLSPERALCFRVNCAAPQVLSATLDRTAKKLVIQFSKPMDPAALTVGGSIVLEPALTGALSMNATNDVATIAFTADLANVSLKLTVKTVVTPDFTQTFAPGGASGAERGKGFVSGAVYDATNGRPLAGASVAIADQTLATDAHGRYSAALDEGAYTIRASATNYSTIWRQVIVPAGAGVVPIDIRLAKRGSEFIANGTATTLTHGGDTTVTKSVSLSLAAASLPNGRRIRLTSVGAQSLAGLLPLGWSPLASAEIVVDDATDIVALPGARLTFTIDAAAVSAANQTLALVRYDDARDEWRVEVPVAGATAFDITQSGNYALVYADNAASLAHPPAARAGAALAGITDPCVAAPDVCRLTGRTFTLNPKSVVPSGRSVATLTTDGAKAYPSGTVVQAYIDEQLNLADGRVLVEPPFAADLLVYRNLAGDSGVADFHLAPSAQAATVILRDGVEQIRIVDYPGRIARGTLIGAEGGRVPGGDGVTIDIPTGATLDPLHATVAPFDAASIGSVAGFRVVSGFSLTLTRVTTTTSVEGVALTPPELLKPARVAVSVANATQVIIGEVLSNTPFGTIVRLGAITSPGTIVGGARVFTTRDAAPIEGIVREGRYVVLAADAPIAFAHGQVRAIDANGPAVANARVTANAIGVADLTKSGGLFVVPVLAKPAAPFSVTPRTLATGDGATRTHTSSPDPDAIVDFGALPLTAQPPHLVEVTPSDNTALDATAAFIAQARFDAAIDPSSVTGGITIVNRTTGAALPGTVSAAGNIVTFNASSPLAAASSYTIAIAPSIRGTNGAPYGLAHLTSFTTRAIPAGNASIRAERIHITIPDANGRSTISGTAGALPTGAQAIAVRRDRFFIETYQATVTNSDGSFSFEAGHLNASDQIAVTDAIDLRILDAVSKATIAVIPLTPFVSVDGKAFLAQPDRETRFMSVDGVTVVVPEGAFEEATLVTTGTVAAAAIAAIPSLTTELNVATTVSLNFNGIAQKPLELDLPIPAGTNTTDRTFYLARLAMSVRGPRAEIDDLLRVAGTVFTTRSVAAQSGPKVRTTSTETGASLRDHLLHVVRSGEYAAVDIQGAHTWAAVDGLQQSLDVFFDTYHSLFASSFYLTQSRGRIVIPVAPNTRFTVEGVDSDTGLTAFRTSYDGIAPATTGFAQPIGSPVPNASGPYPVFGSPFRVETIELPIANLDIESVPGFTIRLTTPNDAMRTGRVKVTRIGASPKSFTVINATTGASLVARSSEVELDASVGDRLSILESGDAVDPTRVVEIVFNEPIAYPDHELSDVIRLEQNQSLDPDRSDWQPIQALANYETSSGGRRIRMLLPAELQRGADYRVVLDASIIDVGSPVKSLPGGPLYLPFSIRKPAGDILGQPFRIGKGGVRDLALDGNVLFVSALEGGLYAFDVSNPATLANGAPMSRAIAFPETGTAPGESWALAIDHHGRVWTTALTNMFGVVRSFRVEDFVNAAGATTPVEPRATSIVSWRVGVNVGLPLGTSYTVGSDRAEAIPRKLQLAVQDESLDAHGFDELERTLNAANILGATIATHSPVGDFHVYDVTIPKSSGFRYRLQRVTVENRTLGLRWSDDIHLDSATSVTIPNILVRYGDDVRITRNLATFGAVALFGFGLGVYDLNAIESNHLAPPSYKQTAEQIALTEANASASCSDATPPAGLPCLPQSLTWIADASLVSRESTQGPPSFDVFGLESKKGVLDVVVTPLAGTTESQGDSSSPYGPIGSQIERDSGIAFSGSYACAGGLCYVDHPRLASIRAAFAQSGRSLQARFSNIAHYEKDAFTYGLVAANQFGILVLDLDQQLGADSLVDIIWVPAGARALRVISGTHYATAVDGHGRSLLIDLSRIDERKTVAPLEPCSGTPCTAALFQTVARALESGPVANDAFAFGSDDPRIIWKSEPSDLIGGLAPVADPDTGFFFSGDLLAQTLHALSAIDPRVSIKANLGNGLENVTSIVPLGVPIPTLMQKRIDALPPCGAPIDSQQPTGCRQNASLGVFRIDVALPGSIAETVSPILAVDVERVPGFAADAPPAPLPPSRRADIQLTRVIPATAPGFAKLRYQKGFNQYVSPFIVAIGDPRVTAEYGQTLTDCQHCTRPMFLSGAGGALDIYSNGRSLLVRPETSVFTTTPYAWLDERLRARVGTVMADTVRPRDVRVAALNPPVATGALLETTYLHSGELQTSAVDLDAGGRAGWNVVFDRTYRSRTIGATPFGFGWDSSIFKRLRALPDGNVEFRDGSGEIRLFTKNGTSFDAPPGYFVRLLRTEDGWTLIDQKRRLTYFDDYGRVTREGDEFFTPDGAGNQIRYLYGSDGRLSAIVDPNNRTNTIRYDGEGFVEEITDWRSQSARHVRYDADGGALTRVELPSFVTASGTQVAPEMRYAYDANAPADYASRLELATNLVSVIAPNEATSSHNPRLSFVYGGGTTPRDHVASQRWATGESATFSYGDSTASVTDVLGQVRTYALTSDHAHIEKTTELHVKTYAGAAFGALPTTIAATDTPPVNDVNRVVRNTFDSQGQLLTSTLEIEGQSSPIATTGLAYEAASNGVPGFVVKCSATAPSAQNPCEAAASPLVRYDYNYRDGAFLDSLSALNGGTVQSREPSRALRTIVDANSTTRSSEYDETGLLRRITGSGGTSTISAGSAVQLDYALPTDAPHKRGLVQSIVSGTDAHVETKLEYPDVETTVVTDPNETITTTTVDSWGRPIRVRSEKEYDALVAIEETDYDASGNVREHRSIEERRDVQPSRTRTLVTQFDYDVMGRRTLTRTLNAAVGESVQPVEETADYSQYPNRIIRSKSAGGAETTITLDTLGRTMKTDVTTSADGTSHILAVTAYDIAGNPVFASDARKTATAAAFDPAGRIIEQRFADGTRQSTAYDGFSRPVDVTDRAGDGPETYHRHTAYTADGQVKDVIESGSGDSRTTQRAWDGAGRTAGVTVASGNDTRGVIRKFDDAGRADYVRAGAGAHTSLTPIAETAFAGYGTNTLAPSITHRDLGDATASSYTTERSRFDINGNAQSITTGDLRVSQQFNHLGDTILASAPNRPASAFDYDARGALTKETLPDGSTQSHQYNAAGAATQYADPVLAGASSQPEKTNTTTDLLGRPLIVTYVDSTFEQFKYDGARLAAQRDRQGRWQSCVYDDKGHLTQIWKSETPGSDEPGHDADPNLLDRIAYDSAGRMASWTNKDARVEFRDFTLDDQPRRTVQIRYRNESGLKASPDVLDSYEQTHMWNGHGERVGFTMPGAPAAPWTSSVSLERDALGNVTVMKRDGATLLKSRYRNAARPDERSLLLANGKALVRTYGYDTTTGQLNGVSVDVRDGNANAPGTVIAGSEVAYDGVQIADVRLLGTSGGQRHTRYSYDARSRLSGSVTATNDSTTPMSSGRGVARESLDVATFRDGQSRTSSFDASALDTLQAQGLDVSRIDPPSAMATATPGHKVATWSRGDATRTFGYGGAERLDDDRFHYRFDEKGRLIWIAQQPKPVGSTIRRIVYAYDGNDRVVGRRAEMGTATSSGRIDDVQWTPETRSAITSADGLPAETTFVWDPISDRLVSILRAGQGGGILRQIIHGEETYDDPLEVTAIDPTAGNVTRLYPVFDEAGAGGLQVVVNATGEVVARSINTDPYGGSRFDLAGAAIDRYSITATKKADGSLDSVTVAFRATEAIAESTISTGVSLTANAQPSPVSPRRLDPFTVAWTFTASQWTSFVANSPRITATVTPSLRAEAWSLDTPFLPPPAWALTTTPVTTPSGTVLEIRTDIASVAALIDELQPGTTSTITPYDVPQLHLLASTTPTPSVELSTAATFQALPFTEPMTGVVYARARWYDAGTGTFLSPDPMGYADSSNLYAFGGGDPVNGTDPTGELCERANASGWWDWTKRCSQDIGWFAQAADEGINPLNTGKNLKRAAGGVKSTAKLVGGAVRTVFWDLPTASFNDDAAERLVAAGQGVSSFAAHPIRTTINAHTRMADAVLRHEARGEYMASGEVAAAQAQTDFLVAYSAYGLGSAAWSRVATGAGQRVGLLEAAANNPVPARLARVVPADVLDTTKTLARAGETDAFVTSADRLAGMATSEEVASALRLLDQNGNLIRGPFGIIEFDTPAQGIGSPVFRNNYGYVGKGLTGAGLPEFSLPNLLIEELLNVSTRVVP